MFEVVLEKDAKILGNLFLISENFTHSGLVYNLYAAVENYTCDYDGLTALDLKVLLKILNLVDMQKGQYIFQQIL